MLAIWFLFVVNLVCGAEQGNKCGPDEFPCDDGSCVDKTKWCDSSIDCEDDSDELYCSLRYAFFANPNRCDESTFFLCHDGQCIPAVGRCDGFSSCFDNSDEDGCDFARNVSDSLVQPTEAPLKKATERDAEPSKNRSDKFDLSPAEGHLMEANIVTSMATAQNFSIGVSSENLFSTPVSEQTDHISAHVARATNVSEVDENYTDKENLNISSRSERSHQPLEFHEVIGMLNTSRNEQNITKSHITLITSENTVNGSSKQKDDAEEIHVNEISNHQSNVSDEVIHEAIQDKSVIHLHEEEDLSKGYISVDPRDFQKTKEKALHWLIDSRDKDYGWGEKTARALTALYMAGYSQDNPSEMMLMKNYFHLNLLVSLSRNNTKVIPLVDLALYINALSASCDNPKDFYGHDLVNILRRRTDAAQVSSQFVPPFIYLVLCLNNATSYADMKHVQEMLFNPKIDTIDNVAVISLAATCIYRDPKFSSVGIEHIAAKVLYERVKAEGLPNNIYELALIAQALNEARVNQDLWNRTEVMHRITHLQHSNGSFGDILATYYAVPTLTGKSLLWVGKNCPNKDAGLAPLDALKHGHYEKTFVTFTLHFGNPVEVSQSVRVEVQKNATFMDVMRMAATINSVYKFKFDMSGGKPLVYSIGGIANDAERGLYWKAYVSLNSTYLPLNGDIRNYVPADGENLVLWMKSLF